MHCKNICFCADVSYLKFIPSVIESIEENAIDAGFLYNIITDFEIGNDPLLVEKFRDIDNIRWHVISGDEFQNLKVTSHFSKAMYFRLLIPELIEADKVLYLDCDILVLNDISRMFDVNLGDNLVGAVINPFFVRHKQLGLKMYQPYFNSGVLLINCDLWNNEKLKSKILDLALRKNDILEMPDQDLLNMVCQGRWLKLPAIYNLQSSMIVRSKKLIRDKVIKPIDLDKPSIVHFSATNKQWHYSCPLSYSYEYRKLKSHIMIPKRNVLIDKLIGLFLRSYYNIKNM